MFCATNADKADINEIGIIERKTNSFSDIPILAEATSPKEFKIAVNIRKDIRVKKSCNAIGVPVFKMLLTLPLSLKQAFVILKGKPPLAIYITENKTLTAWPTSISILAPFRFTPYSLEASAVTALGFKNSKTS